MNPSHVLIDQNDFWHFIHSAITVDYLLPGDILVCENATVHSGGDMLADLKQMLAMNQIELIFLECSAIQHSALNRT